VLKTTEFTRPEQDFLKSLSNSLREKSVQVSPIRLAELTSLAFQNAFPGASNEDKMAKALARGALMREKMSMAEGGSISAESAARHLGITKRSVLDMYHAGKLLAWRTEKRGAFRFPTWQFQEDRRLPGLEEVLTKLNAAEILDDWGKIGFFLESRESEGGKRPLDLLREGKLETVLKAADAYIE
jgi:hypothetical protein